MTEVDLINAAIRSNAGAFFESPHCKIYGKDRSAGPITPRQNNLQVKIQNVLAKMEDEGLAQRIIGLKPRQKGSTTRFSEEVYCWLRRRPASGVLIGGQYSQVKEAWGMMQTYQKHDTFRGWGNQGSINTKEGAWSNGSKLIGETARDVLASVGGTFQVCHCFEVARWSNHGVANAGEVLANVLKAVPMLPETLVILESTAEGAVGEFYERYVRAVDGDDYLAGRATCESGQYVRIFSAWFEFDDSATRLDDEQKRRIESTLDADDEYLGERDLIKLYGVTDENGVMHLGDTVKDFDVWEQLSWRRTMIREECKRDKNNFDRDYPHSWQTAFQKSGTGRFNSAGLSVMRQRAKKVTATHGVIEETGSRGRYSFRKTDEQEAKFTIFEKPTPNFRYILAVDPMTGASQTAGAEPDRHGAGVLRQGYWDSKGGWVRPMLAARVVPCRWDIDVLDDAVWKLAKYYGGLSGTKIVVEMNMDRGLTELLKLRGADLYVREIFNRQEFKTTKALGFMTTVKTRENLIEKLATAIRECETPGDGIDIPCPYALTQCDNFIVKPNGRSEAAEGHKDDDVFFIALGLELIDQAKPHVPERTNPFALPPDLMNAGAGGKTSAFS